MGKLTLAREQLMDIEGLTRRQVAELGTLIGAAGYAAAEFRYEVGTVSVSGNPNTPALIHTSGAWFAFGRHFRGYAYSEQMTDEGFRIGFAPGTVLLSEERGPLDWPEVSASFATWLRLIKEELAAEDFESSVAQAASLRGSPETVADNAVFTPDEQNEVRDRLGRIEAELLKESAARAADAESIRQGFADMREELARMRKGRWKSMVFGTVAQLAAKKAITTELGQHVLTSITEVMADLAHRLHP